MSSLRSALAGPALVTLVAACSRPTADPSAPILAAMTASMTAFNIGDLDNYLALYVVDSSTMTPNGPQLGRDAMKAEVVKHFIGPDGKPFQTLSFDQFVVHALGPEHAYSTGHFALHGGGRQDRSGWFTLIWAHDRTGWHVLHDHSS